RRTAAGCSASARRKANRSRSLCTKGSCRATLPCIAPAGPEAIVMEKTGLKITAAGLAGLMALGWVARLDDLPRDVRAQIATERSALAVAQKQVAAAKDEVARDLSNEPVLFRALPSAALYTDRLSRSADVLAAASRDMDRLTKLEKDN